MGYFPMCVDLQGATVLLVGSGPQIEEKLCKLKPFGATLLRVDEVTEDALSCAPAFVVVGDLEYEKAARISSLCKTYRIPVNVVDTPALCTFFFPSLITRGDLTVSLSTGGKSPGTAAYLRQQLEQQLPDKTDMILDWLQETRHLLKKEYPHVPARTVLKEATELAFSQNRPLTEAELQELITKATPSGQ